MLQLNSCTLHCKFTIITLQSKFMPTLLKRTPKKNVAKSQPETQLLSIRKEDSFSALEKNQMRNSEMSDLAPWEAWTVLGSNKDLAYATHGVFRFFGKFPPPIATYLMSTYTVPGDTVIDPMCGSGTTGVEAILLQRKAYLSDVSPLSLLLAKVKTTPISSAKLKSALARIQKRYSSTAKTQSVFHPVGLRNLDHWFLPKTINSLKKLRSSIQEESDKDIRDFFAVIFASVVRRVSKATTQQGRLFLDVVTAVEETLPIFVSRAEKAIEKVSALPNPKYKVEISWRDLREKVEKRAYRKASLVILHPPYFNAYKYSSINSLELVWLGHEYAEVRKSEVREYFKVGNPANVRYYVEDMAGAIVNAAKDLKASGVLALMIGDTVLRGAHIPVVKMLIDKLASTDLKIEKIALRPPKFTEATWVASQRRIGNKLGVSLCDYILIFRKR